MNTFLIIYFVLGLVFAAFVYAYSVYMKNNQKDNPVNKYDPAEYGCIVFFLWPFLVLSFIFLRLIKKSHESKNSGKEN